MTTQLEARPLSPGAWVEKGSCYGSWDERFLSTAHYPAAEIVTLCEGCPVRTECLAWALVHGERWVWGGLSEHQRKQLLRPADRKSCPCCTSTEIADVEDSQLCLACGVSWRRRE